MGGGGGGGGGGGLVACVMKILKSGCESAKTEFRAFHFLTT